MRPFIHVTSMFTALAMMLATAAVGRAGERDITKRTLRFGGAAERRLEIDNVRGSIHVIGVSGLGDVELVATRTIEADSQARANAAKREVILEVREGQTISIYVDGPFRHGSPRNSGDPERRGGWLRIPDRVDENGYDVRYDFELRVPAETSVSARTVTDGSIVVERVRGHIDAAHVNGKVTLVDVGEARAVTVNGDVVVRARAGFAADLTVKTNLGEIHSDFEVSYQPQEAVIETKAGRRIVRAGNSTALRIGAGGPSMSLETLNGNIEIRRAR